MSGAFLGKKRGTCKITLLFSPRERVIDYLELSFIYFGNEMVDAHTSALEFSFYNSPKLHRSTNAPGNSYICTRFYMHLHVISLWCAS